MDTNTTFNLSSHQEEALASLNMQELSVQELDEISGAGVISTPALLGAVAVGGIGGQVAYGLDVAYDNLTGKPTKWDLHESAKASAVGMGAAVVGLGISLFSPV